MMRRDLRAQMFGKHLRAEADAEKRPLLAQGNFDPVDLAADIIVGIVGAHRAAEDHRAGMLVQRFRQGIAKPRTADVEGVAERPQRIADPARSRGLLMQNDQDRQRGARQAQPCGRRPGKGRTLSPFMFDRNDIDVALAPQTETVPKWVLISREFTHTRENLKQIAGQTWSRRAIRDIDGALAKRKPAAFSALAELEAGRPLPG